MLYTMPYKFVVISHNLSIVELFSKTVTISDIRDREKSVVMQNVMIQPNYDVGLYIIGTEIKIHHLSQFPSSYEYGAKNEKIDWYIYHDSDIVYRREFFKPWKKSKSLKSGYYQLKKTYHREYLLKNYKIVSENIPWAEVKLSPPSWFNE